MRLSEFDYHLPPELIAQHPAAERTASRLLHLDARTGAMEDRRRSARACSHLAAKAWATVVSFRVSIGANLSFRALAAYQRRVPSDAGRFRRDQVAERLAWCREWESNPHGVATAGF